MPGFAAAAAVSRAAGFEALVRATGVRAVAYTEQARVVDLVAVEQDSCAGHNQCFERLGGRLAEVFRTFGIDARVGPVPGSTAPAHAASSHVDR